MRYDHKDALISGYVIFERGQVIQVAYRVECVYSTVGLDTLTSWALRVDGPYMPEGVALFYNTYFFEVAKHAHATHTGPNVS